MATSDKILVIGAGSIGERHIRNLLSLGYSNIHVLRSRNLPLRTLPEEKIQIIETIHDHNLNFKAAFICTPTALHLSQAIMCAEKGIHLFIEKPLSHRLEDIDILKKLVLKNNIYIKVGYMLRYHPLMIQLKKIISQEQLGKLLSFNTHWGEYLPDWHPWEDYRSSYAAKKELGGGAALTLSHDIDLVYWLIEKPLKEFYAMKNYASKLEVNVESGADFLLSYHHGLTGHIHLNFFEKPASRYMWFIFEEGSIYFDYYEAVLSIRTKEESKEIKISDFDRNQLFIDQTKSFFNELESYTTHDSLRNIQESELIIRMCQ